MFLLEDIHHFPPNWNGRSFRMIVMWWLLQSSQIPQFCWWGKRLPHDKNSINGFLPQKTGGWKVEKCHKISCLIEACGRRESHDLKKSRDQWCSLLFAAKTTMNAVKDGITKSSTIDYIVKNGIRCTSDKYIKRIKPEHFKEVEVEWCERMELQV